MLRRQHRRPGATALEHLTSPRRLRSSAVLPVMLAMLLSGCGDSLIDPGAGQSGPGTEGTGQDVYDNPLPPGHEVGSIENAQKDVPFAILKPNFETKPKSVRVIAPKSDVGAIGLVYDTAEYGRVVIIESRTDVTRSMFEDGINALLSPGPESSVSGSAVAVTVRGQRALLDTGESGHVWLEFFENGVEVHIGGPQLTGEQEMTIAEAMAY